MLLVPYLKMHHQIQVDLDFFPVLSSQSLIVLHFTFRPKIHSELIFLKGVLYVLCLFFFFCIWKSSCSTTVCWKDYPFSIELPLSWISWLYLFGGLFVGSVFCSIDLCAYSFTSTMLYLLLQLYSKSWNWALSVLQLCLSVLYYLL